MGSKISRLDRVSFERELVLLATRGTAKIEFAELGRPSEEQKPAQLKVEPRLVDALWVHYSELCRWNQRLSLIGPGTEKEVIQRHYLESLEGIDFLNASERYLMDVGSGGGFPGWVLAAACPWMQVTLVEPRERKWVFLQAGIRKAGLLSCKALNARVEIPLPRSLELPETLDVVTSRALVIPAAILEAIGNHSPQVRFLLWIGKEEIDLPEGYGVTRVKRLPGSDHRRIVEIKRY